MNGHTLTPFIEVPLSWQTLVHRWYNGEDLRPSSGQGSARTLPSLGDDLFILSACVIAETNHVLMKIIDVAQECLGRRA